MIENQPNLGIPDGAVEQEGSTGPSKLRTFLIETLETIILAAVLLVVINTLTARIRVDGPSMEPSFYHNDHVIVNRWAYKLGDIERGDVVVFPFPLNPEEDFIKRIIGLPGDKIKIFNGVVFVNDHAINEPYIMDPPTRDYPEEFVPEGMVFVMGDNRNNSSDSREWGFLPITDIIGKAIFVYWPINGFGVVEHYDLIVGDY